MTAPTGVLLLGLLLRSVLAAVVAKLMTVVSRHVYAVSPAGGSANLAAQKDPLGSAINATMQQVRAVGFIIVRDVTASYATVSEVNARGTVVWGRALHRFLAFTITRLSFCFTRPLLIAHRQVRALTFEDSHKGEGSGISSEEGAPRFWRAPARHMHHFVAYSRFIAPRVVIGAPLSSPAHSFHTHA